MQTESEDLDLMQREFEPEESPASANALRAEIEHWIGLVKQARSQCAELKEMNVSLITRLANMIQEEQNLQDCLKRLRIAMERSERIDGVVHVDAANLVNLCHRLLDASVRSCLPASGK